MLYSRLQHEPKVLPAQVKSPLLAPHLPDVVTVSPLTVVRAVSAQIRMARILVGRLY